MQGIGQLMGVAQNRKCAQALQSCKKKADTYIHVRTYVSVETNIEIFGYYLGIRMYFLVFDYSFNVCTCIETKHMQLLRKLNGGGEFSCFMLLVF